MKILIKRQWWPINPIKKWICTRRIIIYFCVTTRNHWMKRNQSRKSNFWRSVSATSKWRQDPWENSQSVTKYKTGGRVVGNYIRHGDYSRNYCFYVYMFIYNDIIRPIVFFLKFSKYLFVDHYWCQTRIFHLFNAGPLSQQGIK